ncbi:MAG: carbamoyltransferase HypF [Burkholderiaceae bacterium]|jgi:hydrogenase maturation protein HypF|nr:carbamoyltransferase HypF [Burkholderiaceae bacterium]
MLERRQLWVTGCVQGVGFRPFVWRKATQLQLAGEVCNTARGVLIDVQGERGSLQALEAALRCDHELPPLARIDGISASDASPRGNWQGFAIVGSRDDGSATAAIPVDTAVCAACVTELFTRANRRWRHPFITCTDCGPRFTLAWRTPYDRANTSMAAFEMCPDCAREYHDPASRRFHAEPIACPRCGPRLVFEDWRAPAAAQDTAAQEPPARSDPIEAAWRLIEAGGIVAVQGLGGFHLLCDARQPDAVARLRQRKHRPAKPFATLTLNTASAARWVHLDPADIPLLESAQRSIVLLPLREQRSGALLHVAPGLRQLGLMLPSTPIHYLLFHAALGQPQGQDWLNEAHDLIWVATSANRSGQPLLIDPAQARSELAGIADAMLWHDRAIAARCDDSVLLSRGGRAGALWLRRARGQVPLPITLPRPGPAVLALGGYLNNCFTVTQGRQAWVSQHIGDLSSAAACDALETTVQRWLDYWRIVPQAVVCDVQPDIHSSRLAARIAQQRALPLLSVQHHHAHVAAVLAEHGCDEPALGLALDGFGLGQDEDGSGNAWGGELLRLERGRVERLGHLSALALPGGDAAARAPWRMALALLHRLGERERLPAGVDAQTAARVRQQIERDFNCPQTTSLGRWFDAVAGLAGICPNQSYEGEAAMRLEALAEPVTADGVDPSLWHVDGLRLDLLPLAARLIQVDDAAVMARLWHAALSQALADWIAQAMQATGLRTVALAGGCCANRLLVQGLADALADTPCRLLQARQLPPGDGALSLGQAWVTVQQWADAPSSFSLERS